MLPIDSCISEGRRRTIGSSDLELYRLFNSEPRLLDSFVEMKPTRLTLLNPLPSRNLRGLAISCSSLMTPTNRWSFLNSRCRGTRISTCASSKKWSCVTIEILSRKSAASLSSKTLKPILAIAIGGKSQKLARSYSNLYIEMRSTKNSSAPSRTLR